MHRKRYVWVVIAPLKKDQLVPAVKVFGKESNAVGSIPQGHRNHPHQVDAAKKVWRYGKKPGSQFFMKRVPIRDSDGLPT